MEFYTATDLERPVRLSEKTRMFAAESLGGKYGIETSKTPAVSIEYIKGLKALSAIGVYDIAILEIARCAPIRICEGEKLSGAATLGQAMYHKVPAVFDKECEWDIAEGTSDGIFDGVSHLTVNFKTVLEIGMDGIRDMITKSRNSYTELKKTRFLDSCLNCVDAMEIWHQRYIEELNGMKGYEKNLENLMQVPFKPARNFYEAVQSLWFCYSFLRLVGVWSGIGRIDWLLGDYLKRDLENGTLNLDEAREILAHFFIKGCEWITNEIDERRANGDAQYYQNIILAGIDENGKEVTNEVTYLVLDIIEETGISDFPVSVRLNKNTEDKLYNRMAEVIRFGGGIVACYSEDVVIDTFVKAGYPYEEAVHFTNDGCWETQIPGKTNFEYIIFDCLKTLQSQTLFGYAPDVNYESFEELMAEYKKGLMDDAEFIFDRVVLSRLEDDLKTSKPFRPCSVLSLFEHGCIKNGASYLEFGPEYRVLSPHIGGFVDAANSLYAIKKLVFDEKKVTFSRFMEILRNNWEGEDELRRYVQEEYVYYGNDNDEVDLIAKRILDDFADCCEILDAKTPTKYFPGVSTFGRNPRWIPFRLATPFGRKAGESLSQNSSPTPGTDKSGVLSVIKSYCKTDLTRFPTGSALNIDLDPSSVKNENAVSAIAGILKSFCSLGGFFMQLDCIDKKTLLEAQKSPADYKNLSVRVTGYNSRFITLSKPYQDMIIDRLK